MCIYDESPFSGSRQRISEHFALRYMVRGVGLAENGDSEGVCLLVPSCSVLLFPLCAQRKAHVISGEGTYMQIYAMVLGKNVEFLLGEFLSFIFL